MGVETLCLSLTFAIEAVLGNARAGCCPGTRRLSGKTSCTVRTDGRPALHRHVHYRDAGAAGGTASVTVNSGTPYSINLTNLSPIYINGTAANDAVTLDFTTASPVPSAGPRLKREGQHPMHLSNRPTGAAVGLAWSEMRRR